MTQPHETALTAAPAPELAVELRGPVLWLTIRSEEHTSELQSR